MASRTPTPRPDIHDRHVRAVYPELRRLAQSFLGRRGPISLQATAIVHEAWLRLANQHRASYRDERHFVAIAAQMIRRVLVDLYRERMAQKRGGGRAALTLNSGLLEIAESPDLDVLELHEAIECLAGKEPRAARVLELKFFGELTIEEIATVLGISDATVVRDWRYARAWLYRELTGEH
ncbi:MAG: ECF-type sigma factor [Planctomycetota bacterium]